MIGATIGLLLPVAAAWLWILVCQFHRPIRSRSITVAVAIGVGLGLSSVTTMWLVALGIVIGPRFVAVDALLWTAIGAAAWWRLGRHGVWREWRAATPPTVPYGPSSTTDWLVRVLFSVVAVEAAATVVAEYIASPHGQWDAWAIWNHKARFFFRGGSDWTAALAIDWSNPSHPVLVSISVARLWAYAGAELTIVPATLSVIFGAAIVAAVMGALDLRRSRAWIAGCVLLAPGTFVQQIVSQQADVPFAFFMVITLILLRADRIASWIESQDGRGPLLLAGILGSLGAWTKNEGMLVVVGAAMLVAWMAVRHGRPHRMAWYVAGTIPAVLTIAWLKLVVAPVPPQYLPEAPTFATLVERLFDGERHAVVDALFWQRMRVWGGPLAQGVVPLGLAAAILAAVMRARRSARVILAAVGLMFVGYYTIYLLSHLDAEWLVMTSFDRLAAQIWPSLVLAVFITDDGQDPVPLRDSLAPYIPEPREPRTMERTVR